MIQGDFCDAEGAKSVGFSHGDFGFVVRLDDATGELFSGAKVVEISSLCARSIDATFFMGSISESA